MVAQTALVMPKPTSCPPFRGLSEILPTIRPNPTVADVYAAGAPKKKETKRLDGRAVA